MDLDREIVSKMSFSTGSYLVCILLEVAFRQIHQAEYPGLRAVRYSSVACGWQRQSRLQILSAQVSKQHVN